MMHTRSMETTSTTPGFSITQAIRLGPPTLADWVDTPMPGVVRRILEREGDEVAKATSLVRYAPQSVFSEHAHGGGEEILVLEGVFSDESGDYPAGSYLRNPPGSRHSPRSAEGCLLFVKLWQFAPGDTASIRRRPQDLPWYPGLVPGLSVCPLHEFIHAPFVENTALVRWAPNTQFNAHVHPGGEEIYVIDGCFHDETGRYPAGSWMKSPPHSRHQPFTGAEGALIYVKTGHVGAPSLWELRAPLGPWGASA